MTFKDPHNIQREDFRYEKTNISHLLDHLQDHQTNKTSEILEEVLQKL